MTHKSKIKKDQKGISVLLAVLILSSLTIIVLAVSDVVLRVGRSSRQIGHSEIAYYSAEAGIENALYQIEKQSSVTGINESSGSLSDISGATWECDLEVISESNSFETDLGAGQSLLLELNFADANNDLDYPSQINVTWTGGPSVQAIVLTADGIQTTETNTFQLIDLGTNLYKLRVTNSAPSTQKVIMNATGSDVPIGVDITCTGNYKQAERKIQVQRTNWQIY